MDSLKVCLVSSLLGETRSDVSESFDNPLEGNARITHELGTQLVKAGSDVVVVTDSPEKNIPQLHRPYRIRTVGHRFSVENLNRLREIIRQLKPDVVHFHGGQQIYHYAKLSRIRSCAPTVFTFTFIPSLVRKAAVGSRRAMLTLLHIALENALPSTFGLDRIIALTSYAKDNLARDGRIPRKLISVIPYGVPETCLTENPEHDVEDGRNVILTSGITKERGLYTFLSCMPIVREKIPDAKFMVAVRSPLEARECHDRVSPEIRILGPGPLVESLTSHSVIAMPFSSHVSVDPPLSMLECMALGRAVVSTAIGSIPEILGSNRGAIVSPWDHVGLGNAISTLLLDGPLRRSVAENAQNYVNQKYSWPAALASIIEVYHQAGEAQRVRRLARAC
ncbi:glycosyltransferase family 4 protein [Candidatus Bathyarchaeota archaeon]|nr:MAG: glycosyltransferase family 4 protein [Candidatus Bathyarchaeota archaeon]